MPLLDRNDRDSHLVWPHAIVEAELTRRLQVARGSGASRGSEGWAGVDRLLEQAFQGSTVVELYRDQGDQFRWIEELVSELPSVPGAAGAAPHWSARKGRSAAVPLTMEQTMDRFVSLVAKLDQDGLWAEHFGARCPDGVLDPVDAPDTQIEDRLGYHIGVERTWPLRTSRSSWGEDEFYDLIEVLHDLASWPGEWRGHNYGGCVGHPGDFSPACGRALYRHHVNQLLARSELQVRLSDQGEDQGRIVRVSDAGTEDIISAALAHTGQAHQDDVEHAIALFRSRGRDVPTIRSAIVSLAGILEAERDLLKAELLSKDSGALFDIANNFDLRHRKADQKTDYDPAFLEWLFDWYLSTINLVRSYGRQRRESSWRFMPEGVSRGRPASLSKQAPRGHRPADLPVSYRGRGIQGIVWRQPTDYLGAAPRRASRSRRTRQRTGSSMASSYRFSVMGIPSRCPGRARLSSRPGRRRRLGLWSTAAAPADG